MISQVLLLNNILWAHKLKRIFLVKAYRKLAPGILEEIKITQLVNGKVTIRI